MSVFGRGVVTLGLALELLLLRADSPVATEVDVNLQVFVLGKWNIAKYERGGRLYFGLEIPVLILNPDEEMKQQINEC